MRLQNPPPQLFPNPSPAHRESQLVAHQHASILPRFEAVVVFETREAARNHTVAKERMRSEILDQAFVNLGQSQLPALPANRIAALHEPRSASPHGMHLQLAFDDLHAG